MIETVQYLTDMDGVNNGYLLNEIYLVPFDEGNKEYQAIQEWIAEGGEVLPAQP